MGGGVPPFLLFAPTTMMASLNCGAAGHRMGQASDQTSCLMFGRMGQRVE